MSSSKVTPLREKIIAAAKAEGLPVTCSVTPYHYCFCDEDLTTYDTNLKVNPPLRSQSDRKALQQALNEGIIDCIASHHLPQNPDNKVCEFEYAKPGMIGLETMFSALLTNGLDVKKFVEMQTVTARNLFGLTVPEIKVGEQAKLTLFNPNTEFIYNENTIQSKSKNSPFIGKKLKGRVIGIINKNKLILNKV